ncbi:Transcriptional regulatory protein CreB [Delftia tsuruhatensis]|uniref:two-component system response regulator CreB n=1 Tax=Delftia tsuruhatensis TaxID=180282 RepID=UPI001E77356B|nr:two-component system response regulator CreB [Delftia tsuruhatensis]CAB5667802.1 Transcriptional regulatory protein CreB [Delftia tsuruhatensis]CAC9678062.1 Transcriptional regulatory protein CreB [Delftia tsuruhatensis]
MQGLPPTMNAPRVLLVEDDPAIARTVCYALERDGIAIRHCLQLADARAQWNAQRPDLLLLDVGLPDGNGLDWCRELRQAGATVPMLVLSARGEEMDRVLGLELGADDYLTKPFSPRELVARTRALLRRTQRLQTPQAITAPAHALFSIDTQGQRICIQGVALELTRREYQLLRCLLERPGRILSREFLLDSIWGQDSDSTDRTVDTHVKTLRAKLRTQAPHQDFIATHRGMGYSLTLPD